MRNCFSAEQKCDEVAAAAIRAAPESTLSAANASDKAIVEAVVGLGRALDVDIVAEGVETTVQRETLMQMGCAFYQGFLCAPGVESRIFQDMLQAQKSGLESGFLQSAQ